MSAIAAAVSALVAVSASGAHLEIPDWCYGVIAISLVVGLITLPFRIFYEMRKKNSR